jgi:hypothetical protein
MLIPSLSLAIRPLVLIPDEKLITQFRVVILMIVPRRELFRIFIIPDGILAEVDAERYFLIARPAGEHELHAGVPRHVSYSLSDVHDMALTLS